MCSSASKTLYSPIYNWGQAVDLRVDIEPILNMSINELKVEMKKTPKFLRTIRSNKAPIILRCRICNESRTLQCNGSKFD